MTQSPSVIKRGTIDLTSYVILVLGIPPICEIPVAKFGHEISSVIVSLMVGTPG